VTCNGAPLADVEIQLDNERQVRGSARPLRTLSRTRTDAQGRFMTRLRSGTVRVVADRSDRNRVAWHSWNLWSNDSVFVPAGGSVQQEFTVTACAVRVRLVDATDQPVSGVDMQLRNDTNRIVHSTKVISEDGWIEIELEPGTFAASVLPRDLQQPRLSLGEVTAMPGKTMEVTLRLPPDYYR
jgi:hypothetical protein